MTRSNLWRHARATDAGRWTYGKLEGLMSCPGCGEYANEPAAYQRQDDEGLMPDIWHMAHCNACGSLYLNPRPDSRSLPYAYSYYYTHQPCSRNEQGGLKARPFVPLVSGYLNERFGLRRLPYSSIGYYIFSALEPLRLKLDYWGRHLNRLAPERPGSLLDIGCGNGAFLDRAREMGWNVMGCEPDIKAVDACRYLELDVVQGDAFDPRLDAKSFDVITLSHVLEHVVDFEKLLKRIFRLLRPGGYVWIAVPNPQSIGLKVFGSAWKGLHPPFHFFIPSRRVLRLSLHTVGFIQVKAVRRGQHTKSDWTESLSIARRTGETILPDLLIKVLGSATDLLSSCSTRWADETILVAYKPGVRDDA